MCAYVLPPTPVPVIGYPSNIRVGTMDQIYISKHDMLYLNQSGYYVRVPFAFSRAELEVKLDQKHMFWFIELFSTLFVDVKGAGFDSPMYGPDFIVQLPRLQKIHRNRH